MQIKVNEDITAIPFCKECKWYYRSIGDFVWGLGHKFGKCKRPDLAFETQEINLVTGKITKRAIEVNGVSGHPHAEVQRKFDLDDCCGPKAKFFTPKDKVGTFKLLKRKDFN